MARNSINIATLYSSAQCILSVVGSVGVILLFAGIPQLIYSPAVSASNLLTFVTGAVLIMTMVAGNTFLNYKFRRLDQGANRQGTSQDGSGDGSVARAGDPEDKPPSYDTVLTLDEPPPEYASIVPQKPPKYEEVVKTYTACVPVDDTPAPTTWEIPPQPLTERSPVPRSQKRILTLNRVEEEVMEEERSSENEQSDKCQVVTGSVKPEDEEQGSSEQNEEQGSSEQNEEQGSSDLINQSLSSRDRHCVAKEAAKNTNSQFLGESET